MRWSPIVALLLLCAGCDAPKDAFELSITASPAITQLDQLTLTFTNSAGATATESVLDVTSLDATALLINVQFAAGVSGAIDIAGTATLRGTPVGMGRAHTVLAPGTETLVPLVLEGTAFPIDGAAPLDFSQMPEPDLAMPPDLARSLAPDSGTPPDLVVSRDLTVPPDIAVRADLAAAPDMGGVCANGLLVERGACVDPEWAQWPMPNPAGVGLPNPVSYDTSTPGIVLDRVTGLVWQRAVDPNSYTWDANAGVGSAQFYCKSLVLAGGGWRLPSAIELASLVDFTRPSPAIDPNAFPTTPADYFWTSSPAASLPVSAWDVTFNTGATSSDGVGSARRVRCVR